MSSKPTAPTLEQVKDVYFDVLTHLIESHDERYAGLALKYENDAAGLRDFVQRMFDGLAAASRQKGFAKYVRNNPAVMTAAKQCGLTSTNELALLLTRASTTQQELTNAPQ